MYVITIAAAHCDVLITHPHSLQCLYQPRNVSETIYSENVSYLIPPSSLSLSAILWFWSSGKIGCSCTSLVE